MFAIAYGFYSRVVISFNPVTFADDQIRDATEFVNMSRGMWPTLGPIVTVGDKFSYFLPPIFFYLIFPFTLFGNTPNMPFIVHGVLSFITLFLFAKVIYLLFDKHPKPQRLLFTALAMAWWSIFIDDIVNTTFAWNPSSIPFFLLIFWLLSKKILDAENDTLITWFFFGLVSSILISLHTVTLFAIPPVIGILVINYWIRKVRSKEWGRISMPGVSLIVFALLFLPYVDYESSTGWINTMSVLSAVSDTTGGTSTSFLELLARVPADYIIMMKTSYYKLAAADLFAGISLLVSVIGIFIFKGNKSLFASILLTTLFYYIVASGYDGASRSRYQILSWFLPIITFISVLSRVDLKKYLGKYILLVLGISVFISVKVNLELGLNYFTRSYGRDSLISTNDIRRVLEFVPDASGICYQYDPYIDLGKPLGFINEAVTQTTHGFSMNCDNMDYLLYPKNIAIVNENLSTRKNHIPAPKGPVKVLDTDSYSLYRLKTRR